MALLMRSPPVLALPAAVRPLIVSRLYATHQTGLGASSIPQKPRRKAVTAFNDDGRVAWGDLSAREKVARTSQQTFNFSFIVLGALLTGGVAYVMYTEVFSSDSKTSHFNRAVDQIKKDSRCIDLLGDGKKIVAYGEPTWNKWARARPIASSLRTDSQGVQHLIMRFNVQGPLNNGVVNLHMVKRPTASEFDYKYLALDVKGHQRLYLENSDSSSSAHANGKTKIFGVFWS